MSTRSKWVNGILTFFEDTGYETVNPVAPVTFYDDFLNTQLRTVASGIEGWTVLSVGTPTTEAILANQHGGVYTIALAATSEKETCGLTWGDALNWNIDKGPIFEIRAKISVAPTDLAEIYFGFANAHADGPLSVDGPTIHAMFDFDGSLTPGIYTDDDSTDHAVVSTGVLCTTGAYNIFRIDMTDASNVKFFIDGVGVGTSDTFIMTNGTNVVVQPYIMAHKESGTGVGTINVDYVRVWCGR